MRIERRMKKRVITIQRSESVDRGRVVGISPSRGSTPRVYHFRLKRCDTTEISSCLRRVGIRVLKRT